LNFYAKELSVNRVKIFFMLSVSILAGCMTQMQKEESLVLDTQNIKTKNYVVGQASAVNVGEPLVKFQNYWVTRTEESVATVDRRVQIKGGPIEINLVPGRQYPVVGTMLDDGIKYTLVRVEAGPLLMISPSGGIRTTIAGQPYPNSSEIVKVVWTMSVSDPGAIVTREKSMKIDSRRGYENYELIYTGIGAGALNITYREFSPEGLARVAFFQNLTYPVGSSSISFKKYRIQILEATSERIRYIVLEDGQ